jgi:hypothetical protein
MAIQATAKDLVAHWRGAAEKGTMNRNTALSLATASESVLSVQDGWEAFDVHKLDVEDAITRFTNLRHTKHKPGVLDTYAKRFRNAVESYRTYLADPAAWKPKSRPIQSKPEKPAPSKPTPAPTTGTGTDLMLALTGGAPGGYGAEDKALVMDFPLPLRPGVIAHLWLPRDLKRREMKTLMTYMEALMNALVTDEDQTTPG